MNENLLPHGWARFSREWLPNLAYLLVCLALGSHLLVYAKAVLMPVLFGYYLSTLLYRPTLFLRKIYIPQALAAFLPLAFVFSGLVAALLFAYEPIMERAAMLPKVVDQLQTHVDSISDALNEVDSRTSEVEEMMEKTINLADDAGATVVVGSSQVSWREKLFDEFSSFVWYVSVTFILCYFFLVGGDVLTKNLAMSFRRRKRQLMVLGLARKVRDQIAMYLGITLFINVGYGLAVGAVLWYFDVEYAVVWGLVLGLLRYIPFVGNIIAIGLVALSVAAAQFDPAALLLALGLVLLLMFITGNFIDPMVHARHFQLNPIFLFISIIFWSWIWGMPGLFVAIPTLLVVAVMCGHIEGLSRFHYILCINPPAKN